MKTLNSDQLRERIHKNTLKMDRLTKKQESISRKLESLTQLNDAIVFLLKGRGLQAVSYLAELDDELADAVNGTPPLTTDELKAGGWWCAEAGKEVEQELARRKVIIISKKWRQKSHIYGCMSIHPRIAVQFVEPEWTAMLRQIHRIGDTFHWGAP